MAVFYAALEDHEDLITRYSTLSVSLCDWNTVLLVFHGSMYSIIVITSKRRNTFNGVIFKLSERRI
jgi:hypothetical protein